MYTQASSKLVQKAQKCIDKDGSHTSYDLRYIIYVHVHTFNLFSTKLVNWDGLLFISMSIIYYFRLDLMLYLTTFWTHILPCDIINVNSFVLFGNCPLSVIT